MQIKIPEVKNDAGEWVELTHGRYIQLLESTNRDVRKGAFEAMYNTYSAWKTPWEPCIHRPLRKNCISQEYEIMNLLCMPHFMQTTYRQKCTII